MPVQDINTIPDFNTYSPEAYSELGESFLGEFFRTLAMNWQFMVILVLILVAVTILIFFLKFRREIF